MKIVTITLGTDGDRADSEGWIIVGYSDPRGGRTEIGVAIEARGGVMPTWNEVAAMLFNNLGRKEWPEQIRPKASANVIRLSIPDEMDPTVFSAAWNPTLDQSGKVMPSPRFVKIEEEGF